MIEYIKFHFFEYLSNLVDIMWRIRLNHRVAFTIGSLESCTVLFLGGHVTNWTLVHTFVGLGRLEVELRLLVHHHRLLVK